MNRPMGETRLFLHARLWLIGSLAVAVLPHLLRLPLALSAFCAAAVGWRVLRELRGWRLPGKGVTLLLTLLAFGTVVGIYGAVVSHEAGTAMLVVMLCLKLIEVRSLRDGMVVVMLGYFVVVSGFLFEQSIFAGAYLFLVTGLLTATLVALNHPGGSGQWRRYLQLSGALLLQSLPLMLALFFLFPRLSGSLWGMAAAQQTARTGLGDQLEMGAISRLVESTEVAFRAEFPDGSPPADELYWRGPVLWHTDGRRWTGLTRDQIARVPGGEYTPAALGDPVRYAVTLEPQQHRWLLALDYPGGAPAGATMTPGWQLVSEKRIGGRRRLDLEAFPAVENAPLPKSLAEWALTLPAGKNPRAVSLAERWRGAGLNDRELVAKGLEYFREGPFVYTLEPPQLGQNPVDQFLFESNRGFCEHFAASFVTLMRAAGVPARLVTGYHGGERNRVGEFLVIRQSNAHAWTEVYLRGQGWVRVDPTSVIPPERVERSAIATGAGGMGGMDAGEGGSWMRLGLRFTLQSWDALNHNWNVWVLGYDWSRQRDLLERLGLAGFGWSGLIALLFAALVFALGVAALVVLRRRRRTDLLVRAWDRFGEKLARAGTHRLPYEGPRDFGRRAAQQHPASAADIEAITGLYEALRYGVPTGTTGGPYELERAVRRFRPRQ